MKSKKTVHGPIEQIPYSLRINPDSRDAIAEYQAYMLKEHNVMISTNKAINALCLVGIQFVRDAKDAQEQAK